MDKVFSEINKRYGERKWIVFIEELAYRYRDDGVSAIGAQLAYYITLSIFPAIIFFLSILKFTPLVDANILDRILIAFPQDARNLLGNFIKDIINGGTISLLSFGAIASLWSSSKGIMALMKAVNRAFDLEEDRPYFKLKSLSIVFTLAIFLTLIIALGIVVFGETIFKVLFASYTGSMLVILRVFKLLIPLMFMILIFTMLYKWSPSIKRGIKIKIVESLPGAIFASVGWVLLSIIFSFYVNNFSNYSKTYGSLGGVIIFLLWLYMSSIIIVLGAEVNATLLSMKDDQFKRMNK